MTSRDLSACLSLWRAGIKPLASKYLPIRNFVALDQPDISSLCETEGFFPGLVDWVPCACLHAHPPCRKPCPVHSSWWTLKVITSLDATRSVVMSTVHIPLWHRVLCIAGVNSSSASVFEEWPCILFLDSYASFHGTVGIFDLFDSSYSNKQIGSNISL